MIVGLRPKIRYPTFGGYRADRVYAWRLLRHKRQGLAIRRASPDAVCPSFRGLLENQRFACDAQGEAHTKGVAVGVYLVTTCCCAGLYASPIFDDAV